MALVSILQPAALSLSSESGAGDSIQSTRPDSSAAVRVDDVGDRQQHQALGLGNAVLVPVLGVALELGALARRPGLHLPRTGARWRLAVGLPVLADLLEIVGAGDDEAVEQRRASACRRPWSAARPCSRRSCDRPTIGQTRRSGCCGRARSNDGDLSSSARSRVKITSSALKVEPSMEFTPWRSSKIHFVGSAGSWYHLVARPGTSLAGSWPTTGPR